MSDTAQGPGWWQATDGKWYPPIPPAGSRFTFKPPGMVALLGAVGLIVAAFLPWLKASAPFVGSISRAGVDDGGDGWVMVACGVVALALCWPALTGHRLVAAAGIGILLAAVAAGVVAMYDMNEVVDRIDLIESDGNAIASVGMGMYLTIISAGVLGLGGLLIVLEATSQRRVSSGDGTSRDIVLPGLEREEGPQP